MKNKFTTEGFEKAWLNYADLNERITYGHDDIQLIISTILDKFGIKLNERQADLLWSWYSEGYWCAGWLMPSTDEATRAFSAFMSEHSEG